MATTSNGKGVLFPNWNKKNEKHPDYTGNFALTKDLLRLWIEEFKKGSTSTNMDADGNLKVDLGAWIKDGKTGKFLSLSVNAPYEKKEKAPEKNAFDDDIPF